MATWPWLAFQAKAMVKKLYIYRIVRVCCVGTHFLCCVVGLVNSGLPLSCCPRAVLSLVPPKNIIKALENYCGDKPELCEVCGKYCKTASALLRHIYVNLIYFLFLPWSSESIQIWMSELESNKLNTIYKYYWS